MNFSCRNFKWKQGEKKGVKFDRQIFFMVNVKTEISCPPTPSQIQTSGNVLLYLNYDS